MGFKKLTAIVSAMAVLTALTACGKKQENTGATETTPEIVIKARNETLTTTAVDTTEATEKETEEQKPQYIYEDGLELATIHLADKDVVLKTGDKLDAVLNDTGLLCISYSTIYTENDTFTFSSKGYELHDVSKEENVPEDYVGTRLGIEVTDGDNRTADASEGDKAQYRVAAVKFSADDENQYDFNVTFPKGIAVGMSREDIEKILGKTDEDDDALYIIDDKLALYVDYGIGFSDTVESIYAMPVPFVTLPEEPEETDSSAS